jgi:hypothetical protein
MCSKIINLCDTCSQEVPTCDAAPEDVMYAEDIYPETKGTALIDAIIACLKYDKKGD